MDNQKSNLTQEELRIIEETERFMEEVNKDPDVANAPLPPNLRENVFKEIRAREAAHAIRAIDEELEKLEEDMKAETCVEEETVARETVSAEDKELIRLGKIYKKRRKVQKYLVLAAALVFVLAFGITSMGGPKKVFEVFERNVFGREQIGIDSDEDTKFIETVSEEEVYQQIENEFGFTPVKPVYLPKGIILLETSVGDEIQGIHLIYGTSEGATISYRIQPNYRESSWGKDIEDELLEEDQMTVNDVDIYLKKYLVDGKTERWLVGFGYKNVSYSMLIMDLERPEIEKIVKNLFFS